jgi:valyl-tRNA synthetase
MLEKTYSPKDTEERLYEAWEASGAFRAGNKPDAKPFTIVIPPPNVTGSLHIGHALNNTLQDILSRFERMRGRDVLWQPGMDHAGIATQIVVERQLVELVTSRQKPAAAFSSTGGGRTGERSAPVRRLGPRAVVARRF